MPDFTAVADFLAAVLPFDCLRPHFMRQALLGLLLLSPVTAMIGTQVVNLRMAFFSDAISHSVFAGVACGAFLGWGPGAGTVLVALLIGLGVTLCQRRYSLSVDSIIGVFFSGVVALGLALISRDRGIARSAQAFFYGDILAIGDAELAMLAVMLAVAVAFQIVGCNKLMYMSLDPFLAKAHGVRGGLYQYLFSALLALTAIVAVWTVGIFLVTALLVVPAAAGRNFASSSAGMFWWTLAINISSSVAGLIISAQDWAGTATGPTVILVSLVWFCLSAVAARLRG